MCGRCGCPACDSATFQVSSTEFRRIHFRHCTGRSCFQACSRRTGPEELFTRSRVNASIISFLDIFSAVVAGRPSEQRKIMNNASRQISLAPEIADICVAVALAVRLACLVHDHRKMSVERHRKSYSWKRKIWRYVFSTWSSPRMMCRYLLLNVVADVRQMKDRRARRRGRSQDPSSPVERFCQARPVMMSLNTTSAPLEDESCGIRDFERRILPEDVFNLLLNFKETVFRAASRDPELVESGKTRRNAPSICLFHSGCGGNGFPEAADLHRC